MRIPIALHPVTLFPALLLLVAFAPVTDCVPEGKTKNYTFEIDMQQSGMPVNATIVPGSCTGWDKDYFTADDYLGRATFTKPNKITVPIENKAGKLSGPNGVSQNGGTEGDCIEVYVRFLIQYQVTVCYRRGSTVSHGHGGSSNSEEECWTEWRRAWWTDSKSSPKEVCPC